VLGKFSTQIVQFVVKSVQQSEIIVVQVTAYWVELSPTAVAAAVIWHRHPHQFASACENQLAWACPHTASPTRF
jgi:hypothetical protein